MNSPESTIVVCDPLRAAALPGMARQLPVACVVTTGGRLTTDLPVAPSVADALNAGASRLVALSPYRGLAEDVALCQQRGLGVLLAGPLPTTRSVTADAATADYLRHCDAGRWRHQAALDRLQQTCVQAAFGAPVFLRHMCGGGSGVLGLWWNALESLELAAAILGLPQRLIVCASRGRGRWHASLTVISAANTTAQLIVTPTAMPGDDTMALGTGGLVWHESAREGVLEQSDAGARLFAGMGGHSDPWPDGSWATAAADASIAGVPAHMRLNLLHTLRLAVRSGRPEVLTG